MKRQMRLMIGDAPAQDLQVALAKERHDREQVMHDLMGQGQVTVMSDCDPDNIRVRVDTEFFTDKRHEYPSIQLVARVQLALHAGLSDKNNAVKEKLDQHLSDAMIYGMSAHRVGRDALRDYGRPDAVWMDDFGGPGRFVDFKTYDNAITATVTPKFKKGLRP